MSQAQHKTFKNPRKVIRKGLNKNIDYKKKLKQQLVFMKKNEAKGRIALN